MFRLHREPEQTTDQSAVRRAAVAPAVSTGTAVPADEQLRIVAEETRRRDLRKRWVVRVGTLYTALLSGGVLIAGLATGHYPTYDMAVLALLAVGALPLIPTRRHRQALTALAETGDVRAAGPLIECFAIDITQRGLQRALARLLSGLTAEHADLLTAQHRRVLNRWLRHEVEQPEYTVLSVGILRAYTHIGTAEEYPVVKHLARNSPVEAVRDAAKGCLPRLERLAEHARVRGALLRPAEPAAAESELLRPANGTSGADPSALLRAADD